MSGGTIAALSSPPGAGLRGIVRVSGPLAGEIAQRSFALLPGDERAWRRARGAYPGRFDDGGGTQPCLLLWMSAPRSFTGEDVAEFHLPGSPPLLQAALARVLAIGAEPARPGEFTRRAFENGRLDLAQAEGVLELIASRNEAERAAASALLLGGLSDRVRALRDELDELRSLCEVGLDFSEAEAGHVPRAELAQRTRALLIGVEDALGFERRRAGASGLVRIALAGEANAGKSSLFNALIGRARALVSKLSGTTRDLLEERCFLGGIECILIDGPGIAPTTGEADRAAQSRASALRSGVDLLIWVVDATTAEAGVLGEHLTEVPAAVRLLLAWNKTDLPEAREPAGVFSPLELDRLALAPISVSALTGDGLAELRQAVASVLGLDGGVDRGGVGGPGGGEGASGAAREISLRHAASLEGCREEIASSIALMERGEGLDLFAEHLRRASLRLDGVCGHTAPEDLLDRIFSRFCLGK